MSYDPEKHHRRSIRLKGYDYSQPGAYFLTICTQHRSRLFGEVVDGGMRLNDAGRMVQRAWEELPDRFPNVDLDAFVVMPNHIHGIIVLVGASLVGAHHDTRATTHGATTHGATTHGATTRVAPTRVGDVVGAFKSLTTVEYARGVKTLGWSPFLGKLWQRNYYEHIIRNHDALNRVREYIATNPLRWHLDRENPHRTGADDFDCWLDQHCRPAGAGPGSI